MRSPVQKRSYGSVTVFWLDREALRSRLRQAASALKSQRPEVREVRLFGSVAMARETAASDADVLITVEADALPLLGRHEPYVQFFRDVGFPVELFVRTSSEPLSGIAQAALAGGVVLA